MKGKLVVVEGLDASGKNTQCGLLAKALKAELVHFPAYKTTFGKLVRLYLRGGLGKKEEVSAEVGAMLYALDRYQYKEELEKRLQRGKTVIADRYSPSNLYQAAKLSASQHKKFIEWLEKLEERLPKAGAVVFLDLPVKTAQKLLKKRGLKKDIHEKDSVFQGKVRELYLQQAKKNKWIVVECAENGKLRGKNEIHKEIMEELRKRIIRS